MNDKFPILGSTPKEYIPFDIIELHEKQAIRNHSQTLKRLAERGGLCWIEVLFILKDESYDYKVRITEEIAKIKVLEIIDSQNEIEEDKGFEIKCLNCGNTNVQEIQDYDYDYDDNIVDLGSYFCCSKCGQSSR